MVRLYCRRYVIRCEDPSSFYFPDRRVVEHIHLPPLKKCKHFINLTNGIEALPRLHRLGINPHGYARLTSTSLEQQRFESLANDLDPNLLLHLALGECCLLYDFGSRNKGTGASRAIWYGGEFIRYILNRLWLDLDPVDTRVFLRGFNAAPEFERIIKNFDKSSRKRIKYYKKYIPSGKLLLQQKEEEPEEDGRQQLRQKGVQLFGVYAPTMHDNDSQFYQDTLKAHFDTNNSTMQYHPSQLTEEEVYFLNDGDIHTAVDKLLGAKIFLGGISDAEYYRWQQGVMDVF
jgi:hypothetical protein